MSDEELRGDLRMIAQSGNKMNTIINELLLLASVRKIEEVEMKPLDMANIVAEARGRLADLVAEHQAEIIVMNDWPVALGRGQWVEEVWINYMSNALKATARGAGCRFPLSPSRKQGRSGGGNGSLLGT